MIAFICLMLVFLCLEVIILIILGHAKEELEFKIGEVQDRQDAQEKKIYEIYKLKAEVMVMEEKFADLISGNRDIVSLLLNYLNLEIIHVSSHTEIREKMEEANKLKEKR
jgi:hypothetical protein